MVMKKFRGRRLRKTAMAVRAEGPRSWKQRGGPHKMPLGARRQTLRDWPGVGGGGGTQICFLRQGRVGGSDEGGHQVTGTRTRAAHT